MLLQEVFDQLAYGELLQLELGTSNHGGISTDNYPKIVASVRMGLTELFKKLNLSTELVNVVMLEEVTKYRLHSDHSLRNAPVTGVYQYIDDTGITQFNNRLIKIERVFDEVSNELHLNNNEEINSLFTPQYNVIEVPDPVAGSIIRVLYSKDHDYISGAPTIDPTSIEVEIPIAYLEPLLYYVAGRILLGSGNLSGNNDANILMAKYNSSIDEIKSLNIMQQDNSNNIHARLNGWVQT